MDPTPEAATPFDAWGIVELMGRTRLAGRLTEQVVGGVHFLRVDVPAVADVPAYTKLLTQSAIFGVTLVSEDIARILADRLRAVPVQAFELPKQPPQLAIGFFDDDGHD